MDEEGEREEKRAILEIVTPKSNSETIVDRISEVLNQSDDD